MGFICAIRHKNRECQCNSHELMKYSRAERDTYIMIHFFKITFLLFDNFTNFHGIDSDFKAPTLFHATALMISRVLIACICNPKSLLPSFTKGWLSPLLFWD
jgi:hypothetical protein